MGMDSKLDPKVLEKPTWVGSGQMKRILDVAETLRKPKRTTLEDAVKILTAAISAKNKLIKKLERKVK